MTRELNNQLINTEIEGLLNILANKASSPDEYRASMKKLGSHFGDALVERISEDRPSVLLACTVEDADFLAKGILNKLEERFNSVQFSCFWNDRFSSYGNNELTVAPILKKYQEPIASKINYLIIVKSIISGSCVVRTNLTNLIQKIHPERIFVVAPVMYYSAQGSLEASFEPEISEKFEYLYFAKDDERTDYGEVIPGIGGSVYERLGFKGQEGKNRYVPEIVKVRRARLIAMSS